MKQGVDPERAEAVAREASVLDALGHAEGEAPAWPRLVLFDEPNGVLVEELVRHAKTLRQHQIARRSFPTTLARVVGKTLPIIHRLEVAPATTPRVPWALSLHRPNLAVYRECSSGNVALLELLQEFPSFCYRLDCLRESWWAGSFIHGDLKSENLLASARSSCARMTDVTMVDWEVADRGDPRWDVGSFLADHLSFWLRSVPRPADLSLDRQLGLAAYSLENILPSLHAFWDAYAGGMRLDAVEREQWLLQSVRFAAARLLQHAFEWTRSSAELTPTVGAMLQLSSNMLERPEEASFQLLRLPAAETMS